MIERPPCPYCKADCGVMQRAEPPCDYMFRMVCVRCGAKTRVCSNRPKAMARWTEGVVILPPVPPAETLAAFKVTPPRRSPFYRVSLQRIMEEDAFNQDPDDCLAAVQDVAKRFGVEAAVVGADLVAAFEAGDHHE